MLDKSLQEQTEKVASKDNFPITWVDKITLIISHTIKYLIPVIVAVMMYEIFMRYIMEKPTMWVNELSLWLAGIIYLVGGIYATKCLVSGANCSTGVELSDMKYSAGLGFTWLTPIGPLTFSYAKLLNKEVIDDEKTFDFTLGGSF